MPQCIGIEANGIYIILNRLIACIPFSDDIVQVCTCNDANWLYRGYSFFSLITVPVLIMGEIRDWWSGLTGKKKLGYGIYGFLVASTLGLYLYNNSRYIYDPTIKRQKKQASKWD